MPLSGAEAVILQTTDLHGSIRMPAVAGIIEKEQASGSDPLWIDCGDMIQGTLNAALDHGCGVEAWMNQVRCDVCIPGNHDFDFGTDVFRRHLRQMNADFLAANLTLDPAEEKPILPWKTYVRNGIRITVIGCAPPYLDLWLDRAQLEGVRTEMPETALARVMPEIRAQRPDVIVLAIHLGEYTAGRLNADGKVHHIGQLLRHFPEISLVLGGHTHQTVFGKKTGPASWFVQAPPYGDGVIRILVKIDDRTRKITDISSSFLPAGSEEAKRIPPEWLKLEKRTAKFAVQPVADLPEKFFHARTKDKTVSALSVQAVREVSGADVAFCSGNGNFPFTGGRMTEGDLFGIMPFENPIIILTLNVPQLYQIMEEQQKTPPASGFSGMEIRSSGKEIWFQGKKLDRDDQEVKLRVAFASYAIAGAGGRYPILKRIAGSPETERQTLQLTVRDALRISLQKKYPVSFSR